LGIDENFLKDLQREARNSMREITGEYEEEDASTSTGDKAGVDRVLNAVDVSSFSEPPFKGGITANNYTHT
jgi:hypothetical protein